jgi:hypothetical protein
VEAVREASVGAIHVLRRSAPFLRDVPEHFSARDSGWTVRHKIASIAQCPTEKNGEVTFRWGNPNNLYKSKSIRGSATDAHSI